MPDQGLTDNMAMTLNLLALEIHLRNVRAGWWSDPATGKRKQRNVGELLCLIHSEISEAMEGYRKGLRDDHLPHREMLEVELADAVIRICDLASSRGYSLGDTISEKLAYNATRADHKVEAGHVLEGANGKKF
jgi:NTP pyrophosphatase (non-canonical NTP hydrolase)